MIEHIHTGLGRHNLLPDEHIVDAGYPFAELMVSTQRDLGITLLGPLRIDNSPRARTNSGFDRTAFTIDWDNHRVTCPQGLANTIWSSCTERGRPPSWCASPPRHARPVRCVRSAPPPPAPAANSCSDPAKSTKWLTRPAPHKPPRSGNSATRSGPASKGSSLFSVGYSV
jgi:hypothetical protein